MIADENSDMDSLAGGDDDNEDSGVIGDFRVMEHSKDEDDQPLMATLGAGESSILVPHIPTDAIKSVEEGLDCSPRPMDTGRSIMMTPRIFDEGTAVEALVGGKNHFYPGVITEVTGIADAYDMDFEDGDFQVGVTLERIRWPNGVSGTYAIGSQVEVYYNREENWFPASIVKVRLGSPVYTVEYEDGEVEHRVIQDLIRTSAPQETGDKLSIVTESITPRLSSRLEAGAKIFGNFQGKGNWFLAHITKGRGDRTFDVQFDDGEYEVRVNKDRMALLRQDISFGRTGQPPSSTNSADSPAVFAVPSLTMNTRVFARFGKGPQWYPGRVEADREDGTYDILYDDSERESNVQRTFIAVVGDSERSPRGR